MSTPEPTPAAAAAAGPRSTGFGPGEIRRIVVSMTATCAFGAAILGVVYIATERYAEESRVRTERRAVTELLNLGQGADVLEIRQYLAPGRDAVLYRTAPAGAVAGRELLFSLDGTLLRKGEAPAGEAATKEFRPLGRLFVAMQAGAPAGFVVEGEAKGYKNRIRFFVALDRAWSIAGVRVIEHEEDPGLGAEVATPWFQGQFTGRAPEQAARLDVTRDPMPEDWRAALRARPGTSAGDWASHYGGLQARESGRPIYAVTGATISSRALTDGVRATILHFRRRWELLEPHLRPGG